MTTGELKRDEKKKKEDGWGRSRPRTSRPVAIIYDSVLGGR
jgi:hypothetical protein